MKMIHIAMNFNNTVDLSIFSSITLGKNKVNVVVNKKTMKGWINDIPTTKESNPLSIAIK